MANSKSVFTISSIILGLIFSNLIFSALGRPLMMKTAENKDENSVKEMATVEGNIALWRRHMLENGAAATTQLDSQNPRDDNEVDKRIDDFRPTDPGHSPGAGHSSPHSLDVDANGAPMP